MRNKTKFISDRAGFTLIELIVVIAIMAILGGVGTVGYSAYVSKANEAADRQMIADIEQALILGAYNNNCTPGSTVGAVGISKNENAAITGDVEDMMVKAFGAGWQETLQLQGDSFAATNAAKIITAIKDNPDIFASVPVSSFYSTDGNTTALVQDVDEIAAALSGVLQGLGTGGAQFSQFWGKDFHGSVDTAGLTADWKNDPEMAANLTVFAAANQINKIATSEADDDIAKLNNWTNSWGSDSAVEVTANGNGYVADLVMNYAQCVAAYNWAKEDLGEERTAEEYGGYYEDLEKAMAELKNSNGEYVSGFNTALNTFWSNTGDLKTDWKDSGQASKDAEAFLASMMAVNSMESNYVNTSQKALMSEGNAFENAGAAKVLDTMVNYAKMGDLPVDSDYVIVLSIAADGTPVISPTLQEE